jgi:deoxycytidylate deaminase
MRVLDFPKNLHRAVEISYSFLEKVHLPHRCRHFSFIFDRGRLVSFGSNNCKKTHPLNLRYNYVNRQNHKIASMVGTHSEMNAVIRLGSDSCYGLTLVNTRINRKNELDYSFPCCGCMDMIKKLGFKNVFYTTKNNDFESVDLWTTLSV